MDSGWLAALATLGILWFTVRSRNQDTGAAKLNQLLGPIADTLARHAVDHVKHFSEDAKTAVAVAELRQRLSDHEKQDLDRFGRIEGMFTEIRGDIKELMKR